MNSDDREIKVVNKWFYRITTSIARVIFVNYFKLSWENTEVVPEKGPVFLLINHINFFDPMWVYVMLKRPIYFAATEDLFRKRFIGQLLKWFGGFPKRKGNNDYRAVRSIMEVIKKGGIIGIFPEGVRTWDGLNSPMIPTIARLIKKLKIPVVTCRMVGGYLAYPRWAKKWRRIPVKGIFKKLYNGNDIPDNEDQIYRDINESLRNIDYELDIEPGKYHYHGLADDITKVLYRCPNCGTMEGLKIVKSKNRNTVECISCFSAWNVTIDARLEPLDENGKPEITRVPLYEYVRTIKKMPLIPIRTETRLPLGNNELIYLKSRPHFLFKEETFPNLRVLAFGKAFLTNKRLLFKTRLGIPLDADLKEIDSLSIEPGDKFHFMYKGKLYRILFNRESPVKWFDIISRLKDNPSQNNTKDGSEDSTYHPGVSSF
ncbi:MAG: 1-acyl-sn-glycerol-3-phosphate acyltransferase [Spirochaetales bacterium]|nr:1-acyl-sn-glycerol-3-phosphate acyltransferase [Spirochaetales bacterium]